MKKKNNHKLIKIFVILLSTAIITSVLTESAYFFIKSRNIYQIVDINASFGVENRKLGLSADNNVLNFGIVPRGGSSTKELIIQNNYTAPLRVEITYFGNISKVLSRISPFYIENGTEKRKFIVARVENGYKNYTGIVRITYFKK